MHIASYRFCLSALACGAALVLACGSSDESPSSSTDDGGASTADGATTADNEGGATLETDGSSPIDGASGSDGSTPKPWEDPLASVRDAGASAVSLVKNGFAFTEGPLWRAASNDLLFNDVVGNATKKLTLPDTVVDFRNPSGLANGMALDPAKKLVVCEGFGGGRRVSRENGMGGFDTVLDMWMGKKLNSPNDVIVRSDGTIYFTDPDYAVVVDKQQTYNGVYRIAPNGTPSLVASDLNLPNGIVLSPDEKILYVADNGTAKIYKFDVAADGSTSNKTLFVNVNQPDGITVNDQGDLFVAAQTGVEVFKADGTSLGKLTVPQQPANVAFGGADRKTLFITARTALYKAELSVSGPP